MKYYFYVPSTLNTFVGRGYCKGGKKSGFVVSVGYCGELEIELVSEEAIEEVIPEKKAEAEKKKEPVPIENEEWALLSALPNAIWNGVKGTTNLVGDFIGKTKWTPLQIALAINEIRNPTSFATKAGFLTIETALKLLPFILSTV